MRENELTMRKDMRNDAAEMLEAAGFKNVTRTTTTTTSGNSIHEMGTARMGTRPEEVGAQQVQPGARLQERLRHRRLVHGVVGCQNPSLTYMAFTARAADHAVGELKRRTFEEETRITRANCIRRVAWLLGRRDFRAGRARHGSTAARRSRARSCIRRSSAITARSSKRSLT